MEILKQSTSFAEDSPAKTSRLPESVQVLMEVEVACGLSLRELLESYFPDGLSSKMFPDCSLQSKEKISKLSSNRWMNSGMVFRGECLTLKTSESPKDAKESLLSEVLETFVPRKYYLTPRACQGIIKRVERTGKTIPTDLYKQIVEMANSDKM